MDKLQTSQGDILIVDDNPGNLTVLASMLTSAGYQVRSAINGETALRAIEVAPPDLVLLDVNMPGMNGHEVCRAIKQNPATADIPVICVSGLSEFSDKLTAFECGASDYVTKPFQYPEVLARVRTHITLRKQQQAVASLQQLAEQHDLELAIEREKLQFIQEYHQMTALDLRNHLGTIQGWAQLVQTEGTQHRIDDLAPIIEKSATRSFDSLRYLRFIMSGPLSELTSATHSDDINSMVQDLINELKWGSADSEKLQLEVNSAPRPFLIEADVNLLYWALTVIFDSVLRYATDDSAITLRVYDNEHMAVLEIEVSHVSEDNLSQVFTNQSAPTLVQNIVKLHDGRIEIEQTPDGGGLFRMLLPLLPA